MTQEKDVPDIIQQIIPYSRNIKLRILLCILINIISTWIASPGRTVLRHMFWLIRMAFVNSMTTKRAIGIYIISIKDMV